MILTEPDLRRAVTDDVIGFDPPLEEEQWGPASVDLRLGRVFTRLQEISGMKVSVASGLGALGQSGFWQSMEVPEVDAFGKRQSYLLEPNEFVMAMTHESVRVPRNLIALVEGRSTYARVGLSMHQTAPWIQPGWSGPIVLEIRNSGPLQIELTPLVDRPCQLSFLRLSGDVPEEKAYGARAGDVYKDQDHPLKHDPK